MAFLTHKDHGAMYVPDSTIAEHQENGWQVSTTESWVAHKNQPHPDIDMPAPRKPGRPRKE